MTELHAHRFINALTSKGFQRIEAKHHTMFWLVAGGRRRAIRTCISHGQRKVDDWLLRQIAREVHLSKAELLQLIECEMGEGDYIQLMLDRGHLQP